MERPIYTEISYNHLLFDIATIDIIEPKLTSFKFFPTRILKTTLFMKLFGGKDLVLEEGIYYIESEFYPTQSPKRELSSDEIIINDLVYKKTKLSIKLINKKTDAIIERSMCFDSYDEAISFRDSWLKDRGDITKINKLTY